MHPLAPFVCLTLPGVACFAAHYLPWRHWYKEGQPPRLISYAIGTAIINGTAIIAGLLTTQVVTDFVWLILLSIASAGIGTAFPFFIDDQKRKELQRQDVADRESLYGE